MFSSLLPHGLQHARLPYPSPTAKSLLKLIPSSRWCHPTISSSVVPVSSCLQFFPASGSFPISQVFTSGGQSIGASASILPKNIQGWFPLGLTGLISLQSKGLSRVFSRHAVWKWEFFSTDKMCPLEKGMANHFSILALRTPWTVWKVRHPAIVQELLVELGKPIHTHELPG